jgi:hypothetical protein
MNCKICFAKSELFQKSVIMNKYDISYFRCSKCGFVQTETPFWLEEAYNNPITNGDIGLLSRNMLFSQIARAMISTFFKPDCRFLDYGGGYGVFTRLMRDAGYDFYHYDRYCENLFAKGFEGTLTEPDNYELITAFEVFEHLPNPYDEVKEMLTVSKSILFTTELLPDFKPKPGEWWYYGLEHGQHISFYTTKALNEIAKNLGLNYYSNGASWHLFTKIKISPVVFRIVSRSSIAKVLSRVMNRQSLIEKDVVVRGKG